MTPAKSDALLDEEPTPPPPAEPVLRVVLGSDVVRSPLGLQIQQAAKRAGVPCVPAVNRPQAGDAWLMASKAHRGEIATAGATLFEAGEAEELLARLAAQEAGLIEAAE